MFSYLLAHCYDKTVLEICLLLHAVQSIQGTEFREQILAFC